MFDEGHRFGRVEAQRATKRNVNFPTLAQPNPRGTRSVGHRQKERGGKIKASSLNWSVSGVERGSALRNRVLFLEAGLQILKVYRNAGLRAFLRSPQILDRPRN